jgi:hypothetical protein
MRIVILSLCLSLAACGSNSSPEGRMTNKLEEIRLKLDTLEKQNAALLDSFNKVDKELDSLRGK